MPTVKARPLPRLSEKFQVVNSVFRRMLGFGRL